MHVTMVREAWTDERLDSLEKRMDEGFREVRAELRQQREESAAEFASVREALGEMRAQIKGQEEKLEAKVETVEAKIETVEAKVDGLGHTLQIGFGLIGAVLVGILGLTAAQL